jgi:hypothetical protein
MKLSKNFTLAELLESQTALQSGFKEQFNPPEEVITSLRLLVEEVLQPLRDHLGLPIRITSGYRCPRLNARIGGASKIINGARVQTSDHVHGRAADIKLVVNGETRNDLLLKALKELIHEKGLKFDQLISEFGTPTNPQWIHISYRYNDNRNQILRKAQGKPYLPIKL